MEKNRISAEEINQLPLKSWEGKTKVITNPDSIPHIAEEIKKHKVIGFDTESKPAFKKGEYNPVALLQIAIPGKVYLIRVSETGFDAALADIFSSPGITKVGVAINDDVKELQKFHDFDPANIYDLASLAEKKGILNGGVRGLTGLLLGFRISKRQQTSNWENKKLSSAQIDYAATDAWVCLEIYGRLKKIKDLS